MVKLKFHYIGNYYGILALSYNITNLDTKINEKSHWLNLPDVVDGVVVSGADSIVVGSVPVVIKASIK